jgi:quinoprotein glucose dehydrogenase
MRRVVPVAFAALVALAAWSFGARAQDGGARSTTAAKDGDWPLYNRDLAATRYSPLKQINAGNVAKLTRAWSAPLMSSGGAPLGGGSQEVPIVVDGTMYLTSGNRVVALDGTSGKEIWQFEAAPPPVAGGARGGGGPQLARPSSRGLGYWPGDGALPPRILFMAGNRLMAVDAASGTPSRGFGSNGTVMVGVAYSGTPTIYRNVVVIGANSLEVPQGPAANPRAFDARTGQKLWEFQTVPQPSEKFNETWGEGWKDRAGTNMWAFSATVDAERGIVYLPIAGPAANYYGGDRPGSNVYANSIVAVDAETGKYKWHFQTVHHDIWDSDIPSVGGLVDVVRNGQRIPAIAHVGKTSYMYILDRVTGQPVFGVEERPVPKGDVPTEWYSPTQPFPVKPRPLSRVDFNKERDLVRPEDTSAQHVAACQALMDKSGGFFNAGPFTPFNFHEDGAPPKSTIQFPGGTGGVNWGGTATDPVTGYIYMNAHDTSLVGWVEKKKEGVNYSFDAPGSKQAYDRASVNGVGPFFSFSAPMKDASGKTIATLPCHRPPWAKLVAVNANTGDVAWETPLGINEALPEGRRNTGNAGSAGPAVTAGGVVFVGATNDKRFRAFDARSGKELWTAMLEKNANANPMTYQGHDGKQYVAVIATDTLMVYSLP